MHPETPGGVGRLSRRTFVQAAAVAAAGFTPLGGAGMPGPGRRGARKTIGVGVIGCGGRGTGAAVNALEASDRTRVVALADLFADRASGSLGQLRSQGGDRVTATEQDVYVGFDGYEKLLAREDVHYVCLATPPHFRPLHLEAAVRAGKHVFTEKPVAVDPAGVRRVLEAASAADRAGLRIVAGTQRRHEASYLELMRRIGDGAIGELVSARCYWNQGGLWVHQRKPEYSDMEWQCRNWLYFTWLSGDHIVEQHIHNLDVVNWALGGPPIKATGMGGREVRTGAEYGNIFDHHAIEYEYAGGVSVLSMCRQIDGTAGRVEEVLVGTKGRAIARPGFAVIEQADGQRWRFTEPNPNPYMQEHADLISAIERDEPLNEAKRVAESTLTAIMGRMSTYTGQTVTWEQAMQSKLDLTPARYEFGPLAVEPIAVPGRTPLV